MRSEAQKRADKQREKKLRRVPLEFNREDNQDVVRMAYLEKQPNMTAFIKELIDRDMELKAYMKNYDDQCEQKGLAG